MNVCFAARGMQLLRARIGADFHILLFPEVCHRRSPPYDKYICIRFYYKHKKMLFVLLFVFVFVWVLEGNRFYVLCVFFFQFIV